MTYGISLIQTARTLKHSLTNGQTLLNAGRFALSELCKDCGIGV